MRPRARIVALTAALLVLAPAGAARAAAGDYCVGVQRDACTAAPTLAAALAASDRTRVFVGAGSFPAAASDRGEPVELVGAGSDAGGTTLGRVELTSPGSRISDATVDGRLRVAGRAERVRAPHGVDLLPGGTGTTAQLAQALVDGGVVATGPAQLDDVELTAPASVPAALRANCATVLARQVTVGGRAAHAVRAACSLAGRTAVVEVRSCVLAGADPVQLGTAGSVVTAFSAHADDPDATATDRLEPGARLVDAGDPAPLAPFEPFEDVDGRPRVTDGDGDGVVRRDVGAVELQPPPVAEPGGDVLVNPGAEDGLPGAVPPGWSGTFVAERYGDPSLPGLGAAAALDGGRAFFSAAAAPQADLLQRIDLSAAARAIDSGGAGASLRGLLGGYGADADAITVTAAFRDPEGAVLGRLQLGPVAPAERGNATNLLLRTAAGAIPPRTRAIDVTLHGERRAGAYTDAYADRLALVLSVPGVPVDPPVGPDDPIVPDLRPFAGVSVITARPDVSRRWRSSVTVACPSATVGRCSGRIALVAKLPGARTRTRVAHFAYFSLAPGATEPVALRLLRAPRKLLARRKTLRARLLTIARDAQGIQRERTVAVTLRLPRGVAEARRRRR